MTPSALPTALLRLQQYWMNLVDRDDCDLGASDFDQLKQLGEAAKQAAAAEGVLGELIEFTMRMSRRRTLYHFDCATRGPLIGLLVACRSARCNNETT